MSAGHFNQEAAKAAYFESLANSFNNPSTSPDLRIQCAGKHFLCHTHVLTRQSEWFQKAINGSFKESKADIIELYDDNKDAFGAMLQFCYAFTYDESHLPIFHIRVFALAEKYFIPGLAQLAIDRFAAAGAADQTTLQEITDAIAEAHNTVYDQGNILRTAITNMVLLHAEALLDGTSPAFDALMQSHPALAADVARAMAQSWVPAPVPGAQDSTGSVFKYSCPDLYCRKTFEAKILPHGKYTYSCPITWSDWTLTGLKWGLYRV